MPTYNIIKNKYFIFISLVFLAYFLYWLTDYIYGHYFNPAPPVVDILQEAAYQTGSYEAAENKLFAQRKERIQPEIFLVSGFTKIDLGRGKISEIPSDIMNLQELETFIAGGNKISSLPQEIGNLPNLKTLILNDNNITSLPLEIGNLASLEILDLRNNGLDSLPSTISNLQNLKRISLGGNSIPLSQIAELSELLPNLVINY